MDCFKKYVSKLGENPNPQCCESGMIYTGLGRDPILQLRPKKISTNFKFHYSFATRLLKEFVCVPQGLLTSSRVLWTAQIITSNRRKPVRIHIRTCLQVTDPNRSGSDPENAANPHNTRMSNLDPEPRLYLPARPPQRPRPRWGCWWPLRWPRPSGCTPLAGPTESPAVTQRWTQV